MVLAHAILSSPYPLEGWDCRHVPPSLASPAVCEGESLVTLHDMVRLGLEVISTPAKDEKLSFLSSSYQKCGLDFPEAVTIPGLFCLVSQLTGLHSQCLVLSSSLQLSLHPLLPGQRETEARLGLAVVVL